MKEMKNTCVLIMVSFAFVFSFLVTIPAISAEEPRYGGTVTILGSPYGGDDPTSFDPSYFQGPTEYYSSFYMEKLMIGDFLAARKAGQVAGFTNAFAFDEKYMAGCLAESWEIPDLHTLIIHLRKGIKWQNKPPVNGRELTADDVVYTVNHRLKHPKVGESYYSWLKSVTAKDKYTVIFQLKDFAADWDYVLGAGSACTILAREAVEAGLSDWRNAVGTGPFILKDYVAGNSLTFVRNPDYWRKVTIDGKEYGLPFVDRIICPIIPDVSAQIAALRTGKVDLMVTVGWEYWDSLAKTNSELKSITYPHGRTFVLFLRCDKPPMNDLRVRKALWMAIDRASVGNSVYGGKCVPLNYPIHSTAAGEVFTPIDKLPPETREMFKYNPTGAKKLLAEAGYPNGFQTSVTIRSQDVTLMPMIVNYWKEIGVRCEIKVVESAAFWGIKADKTYDIMMYPDAWTGQVWQMRGFTSEASWNIARWTDSYFDKRFAEIRKTVDPAKRTAMIRDLGVYLVSQSPVLTVPAQYSRNYWQPWLKNYQGESAASFANFGALMSVAWTEKD